MFSRARLGAAAVLALALAFLGTGFVAAGDEPWTITITKLDATGFPTVRMVATVTDGQGKPVRGLTARDLVVLESGSKVAVDVNFVSRSTPIAVALVVDTSGSMGGQPFADARGAIGSLIDSLGAADKAALITFNANTRLAQPLTPDKAALTKALNATTTGGDTAIYNAVVAAIDALATADPAARRAVILLTDGVDTASTVSRAEALSRVAAAGYPIFTIGLGNLIDQSTLRALADTSRGQFLLAPTSGELSGVYAALADQLLTEYSIRYASSETGAAGDPVSVTLRIVRDGRTISETSTRYGIPVQAAVKAPAPTANAASVPASAPVGQQDARLFRPELVGLFGTLSALLLLLFIRSLRADDHGTSRRLNAVTGEAERRRILTMRSALAGRARPLLAKSAESVMRQVPALSIKKERLAMAGDPLGLTPVEFLGIRLGVAVVFGALALTASVAFALSQGLVVIGTVTLGAMLVGYILPAIVLGRAISNRRKKIRRALPASLDMLAISVEAGLSFDGAVAQVAQKWQNPLSDELRRVLVDFQTGRARSEALLELGRRCAVKEVSRFVNAVVQADNFGVPLSKVLHDQAEEARTRRRQRAEELARTAPVKMIFPMVLLIFPSLFIVILGPAVPRILEIFSAAH